MSNRLAGATIALALLALWLAAPASAAAPHAADQWNANQFADWVTQNMPPAQMTIGILIGLIAGELLRIAWRTLEWTLYAIVVFAKVAARYGAIAAIAGCVLYFI